jgi:hypothetical protein
VDFLAATFSGSTSQVVVLYYDPPACLRVLDPVEADNWMLPGSLRDTLPLATTAPILPAAADGQPRTPPQAVFGVEPPHGWCYDFEKADLARQQKDWAAVARIGDQAFAGSDHPNDPAERFVFIEGYAHVGNWERAAQLSREAAAITAIMKPPLCRLWQRIESETQPSAQRDQLVQTLRAEWTCQ